MPEVFRCSLASKADAEPLAGTAPTEPVCLFLEYAGAWGAQALAESRLPGEVKQRLADLPGVRVQLVRRYGGISAPGVRVFAAAYGAGVEVATTVLDEPAQVLDLDLEGLSAGRLTGLVPHPDPLWLVCTNGSRDLCCADLGRPVAAALAERWPEETWETSHLGGHRFAATLLALPSGLTLGRLDRAGAVMALEEVVAGRHPVGFSRGLAGLSPAAQVAQLHVVEATADDRLGAVQVTDESDGVVELVADGERWRVEVAAHATPARPQSCGVDPVAKPGKGYEVVSAGPVP